MLPPSVSLQWGIFLLLDYLRTVPPKLNSFIVLLNHFYCKHFNQIFLMVGELLLYHIIDGMSVIIQQKVNINCLPSPKNLLNSVDIVKYIYSSFLLTTVVFTFLLDFYLWHIKKYNIQKLNAYVIKLTRIPDKRALNICGGFNKRLNIPMRSCYDVASCKYLWRNCWHKISYKRAVNYRWSLVKTSNKLSD